MVSVSEIGFPVEKGLEDEEGELGLVPLHRVDSEPKPASIRFIPFVGSFSSNCLSGKIDGIVIIRLLDPDIVRFEKVTTRLFAATPSPPLSKEKKKNPSIC